MEQIRDFTLYLIKAGGPEICRILVPSTDLLLPTLNPLFPIMKLDLHSQSVKQTTPITCNNFHPKSSLKYPQGYTLTLPEDIM